MTLEKKISLLTCNIPTKRVNVNVSVETERGDSLYINVFYDENNTKIVKK